MNTNLSRYMCLINSNVNGIGALALQNAQNLSHVQLDVNQMQSSIATTISDTLPRVQLVISRTAEITRDTNQPTAPQTSDNPIIAYTMSQQNKTSVSELVKEWFYGISGNLSIPHLESTFGAKWRGGSKSTETKFFKGRKLIVDLVESLSNEMGRTLDETIDSIQIRSNEAGSLDKLVDILRLEKRTRE
jgi:hypothetical protein